MRDVSVLVDELKNIKGKNLDLRKTSYYLFFKDGVFIVYFDDVEEELKSKVEFNDGIEIHHTDKYLSDIFFKK